MTPPRGEQAPQTVEHLQSIMAKDAVVMEEMREEMQKLRFRLTRRDAKITKLRMRLISAENNYDVLKRK